MPAASDVAGQMKRAADSVIKWAAEDKAGQEILERFDKLLGTTKALSKLSMGLGLLGAGLGLIGMFSGGKSDTDRILGAIKDLSTKVDSLKKLMVDQFESLKAHGSKLAATTQISDALDNLKTIQGLAKIYENALNAQPVVQADVDAAAEALIGFDRGVIKKNAMALAGAATGDGHTPLITSTYALTQGDVTAVFNVGAGLYSSALYAVVADGLVYSLQLNASSKSDEEKIQLLEAEQRLSAKYYEPLLEKIQKAWDDLYWRSRRDWQMNLPLWLFTQVFHTLSSSDHAGTAKQLVEKVSERIFWMDWAAVVYDPVAGWGNHVSSIRLYKATPLMGGLANIALADADKHAPAVGGRLSTHVSLANGPSILTYQDPVEPGRNHSSSSSYEGPAELAIWKADENQDEQKYITDTRVLHASLSKQGGNAWVGKTGSHVGFATTNPDRAKMVSGSYFDVFLWQ